jgi:hypothetical protein
MIKTTQFERKTQSVPTSTKPVKDKVNVGDPPHRCMIGVHQSTPHIKVMPMVVADLRSGHRSTKITSSARILKDQTNPEADQRIWVIERLEN